MIKLTIETEVEDMGEARDFIYAVADQINHGHTSGQGWYTGDAPEKKEEVIVDKTASPLNNLTDELFQLVTDEDLDANKLAEASEGLLPALSDALQAEGYGTVDETLEGSETGAKDETTVPKVEKTGNEAPSPESEASDASKQGSKGAKTTQKTEDKGNWPWNRKK